MGKILNGLNKQLLDRTGTTIHNQAELAQQAMTWNHSRKKCIFHHTHYPHSSNTCTLP